MSQLKADPAQMKGVRLVGRNIACVSAGAPLSAFKMLLSRLAMQSPTSMPMAPQQSLLAHSAAKLQRLRLKTYLAAVQLASIKARLSAGGAAEVTGIRIAQMEMKLKKLQNRLAKAEARHAAMQQPQHSALKFKLPATNFDTQGQLPGGAGRRALGFCACMGF